MPVPAFVLRSEKALQGERDKRDKGSAIHFRKAEDATSNLDVVLRTLDGLRTAFSTAKARGVDIERKADGTRRTGDGETHAMLPVFGEVVESERMRRERERDGVLVLSGHLGLDKGKPQRDGC